MTNRSTIISRRNFIAAAGVTALVTKATRAYARKASQPGLAFAASDNQLTAYATEENLWIPIQTLPSEAPVSLVTDRSTHTLHVLHAVSEHRGLPCGYIESFRIDQSERQLKPLSRQPLSLSGIQPRDMALSPNGKALAVAISGGAAYNLIPILEDGRPGRPQAIRKEISLSSSLPSHPGHIVFNRTGDRLFALDHGMPTLSVFSAKSDLPVLSRVALPESSKLTGFAAYIDSDLVFTVDTATGSLLSIRHHPNDTYLSGQLQITLGNFIGPLAIHAVSKTLFVVATDGIGIFRIQAETGQLTPVKRFRIALNFSKTQYLLCDPEQHVLYSTSEEGTFRSNIDPKSGHLSGLVCVAPPAQRITLL